MPIQRPCARPGVRSLDQDAAEDDDPGVGGGVAGEAERAAAEVGDVLQPWP
jgi:hypothetical protein